MSPTRSKVVIQDTQREPVLNVAAQLLGVLGHDVAIVDSSSTAVANAAQADLVVLSAKDEMEQDAHLERIALLPRSERPRQVAILSEAETEATTLRRTDLPDVKVHVFVKPVHALGLLNVIKRMAGAN